MNPVTRENCESGTEFFSTTFKNKAGEPIRVRRNGKTQTWKTRPAEFKIPVKYGLYEYFYITEKNCEGWVQG